MAGNSGGKDTSSGERNMEVDEDSGDKSTVFIVDSFLCDVIKGISTKASNEELISLIESEIDEDVIENGWRKLFSHFNSDMDEARKKEVINISRTTKIMIRDIVNHFSRTDNSGNFDIFVRWGWTAVTLGARWPLLCHPFVLNIGKTWPSHGPNMVHFKSDVSSVKKLKKFKNAF